MTFSKDNIIIVDGHLPRAEDEDASSEEGEDASAKDEGVPVVKVRRLHEIIIVDEEDDEEAEKDVDDHHDEDKECHLLELLHDGLVEHKADNEGNAHDQEEDGADDIHHQVEGEVPHLGEVLLG